MTQIPDLQQLSQVDPEDLIPIRNVATGEDRRVRREVLQLWLSIGWDQLTQVPSTFPPSSHNHDAGEILTGELDDDRLSDNIPRLDAASNEFEGDVVAFATSDARLKRNLAPLFDALSALRRIRGVSHDWAETANPALRGRGRSYGVIAQEVEPEFPELVRRRPDGTLAVDYQGLVPVLVEAVKELAEEVDRLKDERDV